LENRYVRIATSRLKSSACGDMYAIGLLQDISRYEEKRLELLKDSRTDPMLGIDNKKFFVSELENLINASIRYGYPVGVIFFDIDDFKDINDKNGHLVADKILIEFVEVIKKNIRQSDYFGRWGGDEFVLATGHSSQEEDIRLAQKLLGIIKNYSWINGIKMTISMGIAFYTVGNTSEYLINKADLKMYEAKKLGKNRYSF
jgi:diguanylate cyclase (GGDEF)-like protein